MRWIRMPLLLALGLGACTPRVLVHVKAYSDLERGATGLHRFRVETRGQCDANVLLEKNVLRLVAERLSAKGLVAAETGADAVVSVTCGTQTVQEYVPPSIYYTTVDSTTSSETDTKKPTGPETSTTVSTTSHEIPVERPGYYVTRYEHRITVLIEAPPKAGLPTGASAKAGGAAKGEPLWSGDVDGRTAGNDLLAVAPLLLDQLFEEYPTRSGNPSTRSIKWKPVK